jgi:lipoprotein-anchoring transpeptidase ErfK/SrfK
MPRRACILRLPGGGLRVTQGMIMRLLSLLRPRGLAFQLLATGLLAVLLANPASADPSDHPTTPEAGTSQAPSDDVADQGDDAAASSHPDSVSPNSDPDIDTVTSDDADSDAAKTPSEPKVLVTIDKGSQEMTVFVGGVEKYDWPVSTGRPGYVTPSGTYTPGSMNKVWYSKQWDNAPMPNAIFFTKKGHAIHGTNEVKYLGTPASHGCVRLAPKNAKTLYDLVKETGLENTQVVLSGETPGGEYKMAQPRQPAYPTYPGRAPNGWYGQYGYNDYGDQPPRWFGRRRRLFQPYYDSPPPPQYRRRRGWFRAPGY